MNEQQGASPDRWPIYHLLIIITLSIAAGRIAVVKKPEGTTAFLSANDRSRWSTVACLVERGTYVIDEQIAIQNPIRRNRRPWDSIDKVRHLGRDGKQHYYSSKPPLLATIVAGIYQVVYACTGMTLTQQPIYVARIILALFNLPLLALFYYATIASIDRVIRNDWAASVAAAACCLGTMVLPFAVTLNNHLPACVATATTMWIYVRFATLGRDATLDRDARRERGHDRGANDGEKTTPLIAWKWALLAGIGAGLAAANELPALSMTALWFVLFAWMNRSTIVPFAVGTGLVAAAFFGTNWMAHESWRPPYAHRGNGPLIAELKAEADPKADAGPPSNAVMDAIREALKSQGLDTSASSIRIDPSDESGRWAVRLGEQRFSLLQRESGWQLNGWDDWYEYPGTYWKDGIRQGVDRGEPSRGIYLLHLTIGHHGLFSLTPIWLLMPIGLIAGMCSGPTEMRRLFAAIFIATSVCFLFYVNRPLIDRNYGGISICFRWLLWFAPMWMLAIGPRIDASSGATWKRIITLILLATSVFSVATSLQSPWDSPWLYRFWQFLGWISV